MKKIGFIALVLAQTVLLFAMSFITVVMWRGGVEEDSPLADLPGIGPLLVTEEPEEVVPEPDYTAMPSIYGPALFLRLGPEGRMERLGRELERSRLRYERKLEDVQKRRRELDAWSDQLDEERHALKESIEEKREDLSQWEAELEEKLRELDEREVRIKEAEKGNLEKMADIYENMQADRAGEILTEMYRTGREETVVKILSLMRDRNAAQALAGIPEDEISAESTEKLQYLTEE